MGYWSASCARVALSPRKGPIVPIWVIHRAGLDIAGKGSNPSGNITPVVQLLVGQYTVYAIEANTYL
jgi:hypothetical protein